MRELEERDETCRQAPRTAQSRMTDPVSQLKRRVLSAISFSEKNFPASIGGSGQTVTE
jgi:hypothetical protein